MGMNSKDGKTDIEFYENYPKRNALYSENIHNEKP